MSSEKKPEPGADKRKKPRFAISPSFPLKAVLALPDESGEKLKDWSATLVDLSATGAHVEVSMAAVVFKESRCELKLNLGTFNVTIPGTISHFVCSTRLAVGGMHFFFPYPGVEKAYHRVLEPVMIGASLAPTETLQDSVRYKEVYTGKLSSRLTVWREKQGAEVSGFDFRMHLVGVQAERVPGADPQARLNLKFMSCAADESRGGSNLPLTTEEQIQEARWMYRLVVTNLSPAVPAEVRMLLKAQV